MDRCSKLIAEALVLVGQMNELADKGHEVSEDDGCLLLYGIIRDCAYRIRGEAQKELEKHKARGLVSAATFGVSQGDTASVQVAHARSR